MFLPFQLNRAEILFSVIELLIYENLFTIEIKLSQCLNNFKRNLRKYLLKDFLR